MQSPQVEQARQEKPQASWTGGVNSLDSSWMLDDGQYRWGINIVNRGGVIATRPGFKMNIRWPSGNFQGDYFFKPNKEGVEEKWYRIGVVDGVVYAIPMAESQPKNWSQYALPNIQFNPRAKRIYFQKAEKSVVTTVTGELRIAPTYSFLVMQDGVSRAAFWDGEENRHTNPDAPFYEIPTGTIMAWVSNSRLWVFDGNRGMAGDIGDPLSFRARIGAEASSTEDASGRGDYYFDSYVTAAYEALGDGRNNVLFVWDQSKTYTLKTYIQDRAKWQTTENFKTTLYQRIGCVSDLSPVEHNGLLWWFSQYGWINTDSAAAFYLSSEMKYRDSEMAASKCNLSSDLTGVCSTSYENYLLVAVPSGDTLNSHIWVMDSTPATKLTTDQKQAWVGIWKGIRPKRFHVVDIDGEARCFASSVDYQSVDSDTTFNHTWELFTDQKYDSYYEEKGQVTVEKRNRIYCLFETKEFGDGMSKKTFEFAEADLTEISSTVDLKISYAGKNNKYKQILRKKIVATYDLEDVGDNEVAARLLSQEGGKFQKQSRSVKTESATGGDEFSLETQYNNKVDSSFSLLFEWCGDMGISSIRMYLQAFNEPPVGRYERDEEGLNIKTKDGNFYQIPL